ncbi:hypothetical protein Cgig2_014681 [Carnegiea gigantea]|uniref:PB1 domain-containing protein n=1 Tax=Carnegiea gigantea TaxID=171969 RepID=A0A9Q1L0H1_9CARY|nr:hypothetical protein Cgig2_014681 [Carnegiea gigantea]
MRRNHISSPTPLPATTTPTAADAMEGYAYSYPDSGDSSPRSREIDFENPPPSWEEQAPQVPPNHKVKFMVSYGGKIQPRSHDNLLSYVGGETKILAVDRAIKFSALMAKLSSLISDDNSSAAAVSVTSFKYQLPGEDLDALISVTNDDDLDHMMHEYDRLYRASPKPARLRLFVFPPQSSSFGSSSSDPGRERFVEALNSVPAPETQQPAVVGGGNNVDFLFGLDNKVPVHVVKAVPEGVHDPDRVIVSDPQIDARIQELNRLQISEQQQQQQPPAVYRPANKSDDNLVGGAYAGDGYQKPAPTIPASIQIPAGYWQAQPAAATVGIEQQQHYQPPPQPQPQPQPQQHHQQQQQQPVYMIHTGAPAGMYHAPMVRPMTAQPTQGYYQVQRFPSDPIYREQQVYNMTPAAAQPLSAQAPTQAVPAPAKMAGYSEGMGLPVRQVAGMPENAGGYQVAYDSGSGRQVYYAAPFQGVAVSGDMRAMPSADGKVGPKPTQTSAAV